MGRNLISLVNLRAVRRFDNVKSFILLFYSNIFNYFLQELELRLTLNGFFNMLFGQLIILAMARFPFILGQVSTGLCQILDEMVHRPAHKNGDILFDLAYFIVLLHDFLYFWILEFRDWALWATSHYWFLGTLHFN